MEISTAKLRLRVCQGTLSSVLYKKNGINLQQTEKFKYLGVTFSSDGRQGNKLDTGIRKAIALNDPALLISCTETRVVYKSKVFCFQISFLFSKNAAAIYDCVCKKIGKINTIFTIIKLELNTRLSKL